MKIVLFKSLRNSKRRNKGNFTSESNSNKIKLCGGGGAAFLSELNNIFHVKGLKRLTFHVKLI